MHIYTTYRVCITHVYPGDSVAIILLYALILNINLLIVRHQKMLFYNVVFVFRLISHFSITSQYEIPRVQQLLNKFYFPGAYTCKVVTHSHILWNTLFTNTQLRKKYNFVRAYLQHVQFFYNHATFCLAGKFASAEKQTAVNSGPEYPRR